MSTDASYFWRNNELVILNRRVYATDFTQSSMFKLLYVPCVLTSQNEFWACGSFDDYGTICFVPMRLQDIPPEFRANLLLLGIGL
jgi:hypothetical protein